VGLEKRLGGSHGRWVRVWLCPCDYNLRKLEAMSGEWEFGGDAKNAYHEPLCVEGAVLSVRFRGEHPQMVVMCVIC
jgi:hypothetical protein